MTSTASQQVPSSIALNLTPAGGEKSIASLHQRSDLQKESYEYS